MAVTPGQHQAWQMAAFTAGDTQGMCEMTPPSSCHPPRQFVLRWKEKAGFLQESDLHAARWWQGCSRKEKESRRWYPPQLPLTHSARKGYTPCLGVLNILWKQLRECCSFSATLLDGLKPADPRNCLTSISTKTCGRKAKRGQVGGSNWGKNISFSFLFSPPF